MIYKVYWDESSEEYNLNGLKSEFVYALLMQIAQEESIDMGSNILAEGHMLATLQSKGIEVQLIDSITQKQLEWYS